MRLIYSLNFHHLFLAGLLIIVMGACAPRILKPVSGSVESVAFRTDSEDNDVLIYHNPNRKVTAYSKFMIDPVKIYSNEFREIKREDQALLAETFRNELIGKLEGGYQIVDKAGPGVLRIRTAILDLQPARVEFDENKFLVIRLDTLLARVQMELECVDSVTGERVAALIHRLREREYMEPGAMSRMGSVRDAFSAWTKSLRNRFDAAKARSERAFDGIDPGEHRKLHFEEGE